MGDFNNDGVTVVAVQLGSGVQIATVLGVDSSESIETVDVPETDYLLA